VDAQLFFWLLARVAGLSAFLALAISLVSGLALRTAVLDWLGSNRALRSLHEFTAVLWIPLGLLHLSALLLDQTARVGLADIEVPFHVPYGTVAIGLGTIAFDLFVLVAVTGWLRRRMDARAWQWTHRLSYLAFGLAFAHALLAGTDFSDPAISAITWSAAAVLAVLGLARVVFGRLPA
jgi:DMSO/TMAO reductase YedYZ heme-binding membrane subunit